MPSAGWHADAGDCLDHHRHALQDQQAENQQREEQGVLEYPQSKAQVFPVMRHEVENDARGRDESDQDRGQSQDEHAGRPRG